MPSSLQTSQTQVFFTTQNFAAAWRVYRQWYEFQTAIGRQGEVELAGCRVNQKNCWDVLITETLHDAQTNRTIASLPQLEGSECGLGAKTHLHCPPN